MSNENRKQSLINQMNRNKVSITTKQADISKIKSNATRMKRQLNSSEINSINTLEKQINNLKIQNANLKSQLDKL